MSEKQIKKNEGIRDFLLMYRSPAGQDLTVLFALLLLTMLTRINALLNINTHVLGGAEGDGGLYLWLIRTNIENLFRLPWFNTPAFYPYALTLGWSDNFILPSLVAWPLLKLGASLPLTFNLIILGATVLNGFCTYLLCFRLTGRLWPALIAGMSFMTFPFLTAHLGHPQLQFVFWLPLTLLFFFFWVSRPSFRSSFAIGICVFLSFLCTVYYSLFIVLALGVLLLALFILRPSQFRLPQLCALIGFAGLGVSPILAFLAPYLEIRNVFGERGLYEAFYFAASGISYLSAPPLNLIYGSTAKWTHAEAQLFPGVAILLLSLSSFPRMWGAKPLRRLLYLCLTCFLLAGILTIPAITSANSRLVAAGLLWLGIFTTALLTFRMGLLERKLGFPILTNRGLAVLFAILALAFFTISFGPLGNPEKGQMAIAPYRLVYELLPGFDAIRAISRAGIFAIFALHVLAAFTLAFLAEKKRAATPLFSVALALCLLENFSLHYPLDPPKPASLVFEYLQNENIDTRVALMVLPWTDELSSDGSVKSWGSFARINTNYMNWALDTKLALVNGYSGQRSKLMRELPGQLIGFPDLRSVAAIRQIAGLRYVIYVSKNDPAFEEISFARKMQLQSGDLKLIMSDEAGNFLFELVGHQRLKKDTALLVPAHPRGSLHLELMAQYDKTGADSTVQIFAPEHSFEPIAVATVKSNGEWNSYMVELPKSKDKARPLRITFSTLGETPIFMRNSLFEENK